MNINMFFAKDSTHDDDPGVVLIAVHGTYAFHKIFLTNTYFLRPLQCDEEVATTEENFIDNGEKGDYDEAIRSVRKNQ